MPEGREVDDGQATVREANAPVRRVPFADIVRTAVSDGIPRPRQKTQIESAMKIGYAAHDSLMPGSRK